MITVKLMGGMGNQMFQYATGKSLACYHHTDLLLDASLLHGRRSYTLNQWSGVREPVTYAGQKPNIFEAGFRYNIDIQKAVDRHVLPVLQGYWQTEIYFAHIAKELRQIFCPLKPFDTASVRIVHHMEQENSIAVHVRRGDYLKEPHKSYHGVLSGEYYTNAIKGMWDRVGLDAEFYFFSDDMEWVKKEFQGEKIHFVEPGLEARDIYMMAQCKHAIIANSSFSWWGAWLGDNQANRVVVAPKKWFDQSKEDYSDIVPDRWVKL